MLCDLLVEGYSFLEDMGVAVGLGEQVDFTDMDMISVLTLLSFSHCLLYDWLAVYRRWVLEL